MFGKAASYLMRTGKTGLGRIGEREKVRWPTVSVELRSQRGGIESARRQQKSVLRIINEKRNWPCHCESVNWSDESYNFGCSAYGRPPNS